MDVPLKYVKLIEVYDQQELNIIRIALQSEDINFRVLFENTLNTANVYALGYSGVLIEVIEEEVDISIEILSELGFNTLLSNEPERYKFVILFDKYTKEIPFLKKFEVAYRLLILLSVFLFILLLIFSFISINNPIYELENTKWCVKSITHKNQAIIPNTLSKVSFIRNLKQGKCKENVIFFDDRSIHLPGFNSTLNEGYWILNYKNNIIINSINKDSIIYNGIYEIEINLFGKMILQSNDTKLELVKTQL